MNPNWESLTLAIFWMSVVGVLYAYAFYPVILRILTLRSTTGNKEREKTYSIPIGVIIPAHNEEAVIGKKINNVLEADYPREQMEIVVVSDCSTDNTDRIVRSYEPEGVRLLRQETRRGKTSGLNWAMEDIKADIVVFTDANAMFPPGLFQRLAQLFADERIGLVTGSTRYQVQEDGAITEVTNIYTKLERTIKLSESRLGSCVGADGAIFAMRRSLYTPLREEDINDLVLPLKVVEIGYRCILDDEIYCLEHSGKDVESEYRRQSRITNRTLRALWQYRRLLNPFRFPLFSWFLFSHKVVRLLVPFFLVAAAASNVLMAFKKPFYVILLIAQAVFYTTAAVNKIFSKPPSEKMTTLGRIASLCQAFLIINLAMLSGWRKALFGRKDVTWQHERSSG